jgi:hypothetical protein
MGVDLLGPERQVWGEQWRDALIDYFRTEAVFFGESSSSGDDGDDPTVADAAGSCQGTRALFPFSAFRRDVVSSLRRVYARLGLVRGPSVATTGSREASGGGPLDLDQLGSSIQHLRGANGKNNR